MAEGIPARLTPFTARDGRKFGLQVGAAFLALAAFAWWRGHQKSGPVFAVVGGLLLLGGLVLPAGLGPVYRAWMRLAHAISKVTTPIVLGIIYFLVLTPVAWIMRAVGHRPLVHPKSATSVWMARVTDTADRVQMEHQY